MMKQTPIKGSAAASEGVVKERLAGANDAAGLRSAGSFTQDLISGIRRGSAVRARQPASREHFRAADPRGLNLIRTFALLILLNSRAAMAQGVELAGRLAQSTSISDTWPPTPDTRRAGQAPIGHRQPQAKDVLPGAGDIERIGQDDVALDRKLVICRRC
jgi:hypothetical protein